MITQLPTALELPDGKSYPIRSSCWAALDLFEAMNDPDCGNQERAYYLLTILYEDWEAIPHELLEDAVNKGLWFLSGGDLCQDKKGPRLMDWEQDFHLIIPAINRVAGVEVRRLPDLHWWTFLGYYQEIGGECAFAQVVSIRDKLRRGKRLTKEEREYYNQNQSMIDLHTKRTNEEGDFLTNLINKRRG